MIAPPGFEQPTTELADKPTNTLHTCRNCGVQGHLHKDCPHPIMSFGIICYREVDNNIEYLMIQRKDSLSFMEFIRGKYKHEQVGYISQLLSCMTNKERNMLMTKSFEELWNIIWFQPSLPKHTTEFFEAKRKFDTLRSGLCISGRFVDLKGLISLTPSPYTEPEWGFPKGRRRLREEDIDCAVREFCEETSFVPSDIQVVAALPPFEEIFFGTNNVLYRHVYYVARLQGEQRRCPSVDFKNINQAREVRAINWFSYDATLQHIRPHNQERKDLFTQVHKKVMSLKNM